MHELVDAERNRFVRGKRMQADEFAIEQNYGIARRRLINRAVLGWGVVNGFALSQPDRPRAQRAAEVYSRDDQGAPGVRVEEAYPLTVGEGIAFDRQGREAVHSPSCQLSRSNCFFLVRVNNVWCTRDLRKLTEDGPYILAVHYAEEKTGGIIPGCFFGCGRSERGFVQETAVFSLRKSEDCPCGERGCDHGNSDDCDGDACKDDVRGPHRRLSEWLTRREVAQGSHLHCWDSFDVALHDWVDLGCVTVKGDCDPLGVVSIVDATGPRRLVKNNDLLYDLARGCDLTHISDITWAEWHRRGRGNRVKWTEFKGQFELGSDLRRGDDVTGHYRTYKTKFVVSFSAPVKRASIATDVVVMRVISTEGGGTGWVRTRTVPIAWLDSTPSNGDQNSECTDQFLIEVLRSWANDEIKEDGESELRENDFYVEIEVRGDLLEDCCGLTVDANARGLRAVPTGNGTPGGAFISRFAVERMPKNVE